MSDPTNGGTMTQDNTADDVTTAREYLHGTTGARHVAVIDVAAIRRHAEYYGIKPWTEHVLALLDDRAAKEAETARLRENERRWANEVELLTTERDTARGQVAILTTDRDAMAAEITHLRERTPGPAQ